MPKHVTNAKQMMLIAENFQLLDDLDVLSLARNSARQFVFLLFALRAEFEKYRADAGDPSLTDLKCFQEILHAKLLGG